MIKSSQILKSYYEYHMWGLQKYQNHYEIPLFGRGCIDLKNSAVLLLWAQGKSDTLSLFEDFNMARYFKNIFLIWINVNRLCWHVGLEFWTINSFICPKSTNLTTCQFCFTTLYSFFSLSMKLHGETISWIILHIPILDSRMERNHNEIIQIAI